MITEAATVLWKEFKEIQSQGTRGKITFVMLTMLFGVLPPLQLGRTWVESPLVLAWWTWVPLTLVAGMIADSIAGERERHTLETLLASGLSDRGILFGKIGAAVGYGWGMTLISVTLGLITVNLVDSKDGLLSFSWVVAIGIVTLSFLSASLAAGAGILVSMWAQTVRQAYQVLSISILVTLVGPLMVVRVLPMDVKMSLATAIANTGLWKLVVMSSLTLAIVDTGLFLLAAANFKRSRLIF